LIDVNAPIAAAFAYVRYDWAKYVVAVGAIISLFNSLYSGIYPPARITYSMANDGILFGWCSVVLPKFHTPIVSTLITGLITGTHTWALKKKHIFAPQLDLCVLCKPS
jgi:amino acid transporter